MRASIQLLLLIRAYDAFCGVQRPLKTATVAAVLRKMHCCFRCSEVSNKPGDAGTPILIACLRMICRYDFSYSAADITPVIIGVTHQPVQFMQTVSDALCGLAC